MRGDLALVAADRADRSGNAWFRGSNRNMCIVMASACDRVVVEAKEIVETGAIEPEDVHLPCVFVDAVARQPLFATGGCGHVFTFLATRKARKR